jgi:hypothetical protein
MKKIFVAVALSGLAAGANDSLARFEGGIAAESSATVNEVRGFLPGLSPWRIGALQADVKPGGRITVSGRGLVMAGGNAVGTAPGLRVRAVLLCEPGERGPAHLSPEVALESNGDFFIDGQLTPAPPASCVAPALLIVSSSRWLAAGIPTTGDTGTRD